MAYSYTEKKRIRMDFGKLPEVLPIPDMLLVQCESYQAFLQREVKPSRRKDQGIQAVLNAAFPIVSHAGHIDLNCLKYEIGEPAFNVRECKRRGQTYMAPLHIKTRMVIHEKDVPKDGKRKVKEIKEQDVYMGDIPLMTEHGTFVINGTERVVVSQLLQSPGVIFTDDKGRGHSSGKILHHARIKPEYGSWLEFGFDHKDLIFLRVDSRRKIPVTILLRAVGLSEEGILETFTESCPVRMEQWRVVPVILLEGAKTDFPLIDAQSNETLLPAGRRISAATIEQLAQQNVENVLIPQEFLKKHLAPGKDNDAYAFEDNNWQVRSKALIGEKLPFTLTHNGKIAVRVGTRLTAARAEKLPAFCPVEMPLRSRFFIDINNFRRQKLAFDVDVEKAGVQVRAGRTLMPVHIKKLQEAGHNEIEVPASFLIDRALARDLFDLETGEIYSKFHLNTLLDEDLVGELMALPVDSFEIIQNTEATQGIPGTLRTDDFHYRPPQASPEQVALEAQTFIYRILRPQ